METHRTLKRKDNTEAVNEFGPHSMKFHNTIIYVNSALSDKHHSSASPAQFSSLIFTKATEIFHQPQPTKRGFNEMLRPQIEIRKVIINRNCVWMCFWVGFGFSRAISLSFFVTRRVAFPWQCKTRQESILCGQDSTWIDTISGFVDGFGGTRGRARASLPARKVHLHEN